MCIYGRPIYTTCSHPGALYLQQLCSGAGYDRLTSDHHGMALTAILATVGNPCNVIAINQSPFKTIDGVCDGCRHVAAQGEPSAFDGLHQTVIPDTNNISSAWLSSPFQDSSPNDWDEQRPNVAQSPLERQRRRPHLTRDNELRRVGNRVDVGRAQRLADEDRALDEEFDKSRMKMDQKELPRKKSLTKPTGGNVDEHDVRVKAVAWDSEIGSSDYWKTEEEKDGIAKRGETSDKTFS